MKTKSEEIADFITVAALPIMLLAALPVLLLLAAGALTSGIWGPWYYGAIVNCTEYITKRGDCWSAQHRIEPLPSDEHKNRVLCRCVYPDPSDAAELSAR